VLVKPSLYDNITTAANYYYNYSTKQRVSALLGHHQAYKTVELVKVHSVFFFTYGIPWSAILLSIFLEMQIVFKTL